MKNLIGISGKIGSGKDTVAKIIQWLTQVELNDYPQELFIEELNSNKFNGDIYSEWKIAKYAAKLKQIVSILTGIPVEDLEKQEVKDRVLGEEWWKYKITSQFDTTYYTTKEEALESHGGYYTPELIKPTVRQLLQNVGTEAMRNVINPNIWVIALFADYKPNGTPYNNLGDLYDDLKHCPSETKLPNWIITDMRFPNELKAVKDRSGITIRVNRKKINTVSPIGTPIEVDRSISGLPSGHPSETALDHAEFDYVIDNNGTIEELIEKVKEILI